MLKKSLIGVTPLIAALLLCSCEDKQAREQITEQQQKIDALSSQLVKLNNDIEALRRENSQLQTRVTKIVDFIRAREQQAVAAKQTTQEKPTTKTTTGTTEKKKSSQ